MNKNNSIEINIVENEYDLDINDLITLGNRANNDKRNFLFVSKVLGKHLEVVPDVCRAIGFILASKIFGKSKYTEQLIRFLGNPVKYKSEVKEAMKAYYRTNENICVLGFAETATGLGMAVASAIKGAYYVTTTREDISDIKSLLNFEEEHSHATTHKCFVEDRAKVVNADRIILVDDEITTGKSMINIIKNLEETTNVKKYTVLSILDWRGKEHRELFNEVCKERSINIEVISLMAGDISVNDKTVLYDSGESVLEESMEVINLDALERVDRETSSGIRSYFKNTGRFGVHYSDIEILEDKCKEAALKIQDIIKSDKRILVLGHGENIYIPSRVAAYLEGDIYFKSTTRSPIYCINEEGYPIKEKHSFNHEGVKYYVYNKKSIEEKYYKTILITEDDLDIKLTDNLVIIRL